MSSGKKEPEKHWILISLLMIISTCIVEIFYIDRLWNAFQFFYFLLIWILILGYILDNFLRRKKTTLKDSFLKIKERNVYESWYFLSILALIFLSVVILINLYFGETWGIAVFGFLYGVLGLVIVDVLRYNRNNKKS